MPASKVSGDHKLPIFTDSDKPSWLADWNPTMTKIQGEFDAQITRYNDIMSMLGRLQARITELENK